MNNKRYKLTISLLASNRKDTLPKTLESLKPILDNVSSELIVVDTGCDEDLLEVVRQYTKKIIKFQWCRDFSKARNVGIDNAQGDWFMFIDDDEWFEDVTEFIDFFNSKEMNKYNYGKYVVRNYENMEGTAWTDSIAGRMFRLFPGTRFIDAIHERPTNIAGPTKSFSSYAHHYGYVYKSEEDRRAHIKRNTDLLLEQIEKEPHCARHYCHLSQEYNTIKEYEKSLECALEGIKQADMNISENDKDVSGLYGNVIWVMLNQLRYEEVIEKSKEFLEIPHINKLAKGALYGFCATAAYKLGRYEESMAYADLFVDAVKYFNDNPDKLYSQDAVIISITVREDNADRINGVAFVAAVMNGDLNKAKKYIDNMHRGMVIIPDVEKTMNTLADLIGSKRDKAVSAEILKKVMCNNGYFGVLLNRVENIRDTNIDAYFNIADVMAMTESYHAYVQFMRIISKRDESAEELEALYRRIIDDVSDLINLHHHFWAIAAKRQIHIADMVAVKPMNRWMVTVDEWAKNIKIKGLIEKKQDLSNVLYADGMHMKYFDMVLTECFLYRKKIENISLEEVKSEMLRFTNVVMSFYREIYKDNIFIECPTILPNRCQVAMHFMKVLCNDAKDVEAELTSAYKIMPAVKPIVLKYLELINT